MKHQHHSVILKNVKSILSEHWQRLNNIKQKSSTSIWKSYLPLEDGSYTITKELFWDFRQICYGWELTCPPETCVCGSRFNLWHALFCKKGVFVTMRHNLQLTARVIKEICGDVQVQPQLRQLSGEKFEAQTRNKCDDAPFRYICKRFLVFWSKAIIWFKGI